MIAERQAREFTRSIKPGGHVAILLTQLMSVSLFKGRSGGGCDSMYRQTAERRKEIRSCGSALQRSETAGGRVVTETLAACLDVEELVPSQLESVL